MLRKNCELWTSEEFVAYAIPPYSPEQHWSLMPFHAICSMVKPASCLYGTGFSTIERKLTSSNPAKPDANPSNPRYYSADEFISEVRLVFSNTLTFNGPDNSVTQIGKRVEGMSV